VIEDLRELPRGTAVSADVCLIGAGAAGITIAQELAGSALNVCLVEGGGLQYEYQDSQSLYRGNSIGVPVSLDGGRLRYLGGSSNHWGGRWADLDPYYARARKVAGFSSAWLPDADTLSYLNIVLPSINPEWLKPFLWHFTPAMKDAPVWKWANAYTRVLRESNNIHTLLHANFAKFSTEQDRTRVRNATFRSLNGISAVVSATTFVVCCGGIENARVLLLGAEQNAGGFGNKNDLVGRYFMQHPRGPAGLIVSAERMSRVQEQFNILRGRDGLEIEVGLTLTPKLMENERVLNGSAVLQYQGDPESGVTAAQDIWRSLLAGRWPPDVGDKVGLVAGDFGAFARGLQHRLSSGHSLVLEGSAGIPSRSAIITLDLEQAPNPESRVSLAQERDVLGLRQVEVNWRLGELERRTAATLTRYIGAEFARLGIGRCRMEPWLQDDRIPLTDALRETYHYIGTTRMADDPRDGVVDRNCVVHGMENLYVAGSSVFPTAGQANPTLTIVALALRLADNLRR
jgi:choline dehydrogenase-like flavoprotein